MKSVHAGVAILLAGACAVMACGGGLVRSSEDGGGPSSSSSGGSRGGSGGGSGGGTVTGPSGGSSSGVGNLTGSSSGGTVTGSSSGPTSSSGGECQPPYGTYVVTQTATGDAANCVSSNSTTTVENDDAGDAGLPDGCVCTGNTLTCKIVQEVNGTTDIVGVDLTITSTGYSGTESVEELAADGGVFYSCDYDVTGTLQ
jgi:hypothetical protein